MFCSCNSLTMSNLQWSQDTTALDRGLIDWENAASQACGVLFSTLPCMAFVTATPWVSSHSLNCWKEKNSPGFTVRMYPFSHDGLHTLEAKEEEKSFVIIIYMTMLPVFFTATKLWFFSPLNLSIWNYSCSLSGFWPEIICTMFVNI